MLNLIIWLIVLFITITWTVGVVFKPKKMGGEQSWGPVNFKIAILWWISIIFVFIFCIICEFVFFKTSLKPYKDKLVKLENKVEKELRLVRRQLECNEDVRNKDREFFTNEISILYNKIEELEENK